MNLTSSPALPTTLVTPGKRKASVYEDDDFDNSENINPAIFASPKRSKGKDGLGHTDYCKPTTSHFVLTKAPPSPNEFAVCSPIKSNVARPMLQPRSQTPKLNAAAISALSAPAGRSPTRKRVGILNRRRTASPFTRVDPPQFSIGRPVTSAPFSIAAALGGTIPSYRQRTHSPCKQEKIPSSLHELEVKAGWFFDIHEDTVEETMTNLMEHSTHVLDISSDEESVVHQRDRDERGKENVPPADDVSQTSSRSFDSETQSRDGKSALRVMRRHKEIEEGAIEIDRAPLTDLVVEEFYAEGCSDKDIVYIVEDEDDVPATQMAQSAPDNYAEEYKFGLAVQENADVNAGIDGETEMEGGNDEGQGKLTVGELMQRSSEIAGHAALFEPLEKAEEGFEVWESASAKGEGDGDE
jgi:hypothetical protein